MSFRKKINLFLSWPKRELNWWVSNLKSSKEFRYQLLLVTSGFSIGGILWSWQCYDWAITTKEPFLNPFSFLIGALFLAIFGSLGVGFAFLRGNKKKFLILLLSSIPAWGIAFYLPGIFSYWLWIAGLIIYRLGVIGVIFLSLMLYKLFSFQPISTSLFDLPPSLNVGSLSLEFVFTFLIISIFYLFSVKKNFALYSFKRIPFLVISCYLIVFISPLISNFIALYLFRSLLLAYSLTFFLISFVFGLSLFRAIKYEKR